MTLKVGDRVKLSAGFLRSIGGFDPDCETLGKVVKIIDVAGWILVDVKFNNSERRLALANLVHLKDTAQEAREAEKLPGVTIGRGKRYGD